MGNNIVVSNLYTLTSAQVKREIDRLQDDLVYRTELTKGERASLCRKLAHLHKIDGNYKQAIELAGRAIWYVSEVDDVNLFQQMAEIRNDALAVSRESAKLSNELNASEQLAWTW